MFKNSYPLFERKRLLKIEMLNNLRDFPRDLFRIFYQEYADGIVAGVDIRVVDNYLIIHPGILYCNGIPYIMNDSTKIAYEATEKLSYLKVKFLEELHGVEKHEYLTQIYIDDMPPAISKEMELARFKLQRGARLRSNYTDFADYDTEFDTLNRIYVPFASPEASTIWPEILKSFARILMEYQTNNPWDCSFCLNCLQLEQGMPGEALTRYLNLRLKKNHDSYSNQKIYAALKQILETVRHGDMGDTQGKAERRIMLL